MIPGSAATPTPPSVPPTGAAYGGYLVTGNPPSDNPWANWNNQHPLSYVDRLGSPERASPRRPDATHTDDAQSSGISLYDSLLGPRIEEVSTGPLREYACPTIFGAQPRVSLLDARKGVPTETRVTSEVARKGVPLEEPTRNKPTQSDLQRGPSSFFPVIKLDESRLAWHAQAKLPGRGEGLLVDVGAHDNLVGE